MRRQYTADDSQPIGQDQESAGLLSCLPSDWWKSTHPESSFPEVASASGAGKSTLPESPGLPVPPFSFSDFGFGLNEDLAVANQSSSSEACRPGPSKHRRKQGGPSSKRTEPLPCLTCSKTFLRRCELTKHLKTHNRAFKCDVSGCRSQGFYRMQDLNRHASSCHGGRHANGIALCEYQDCEYATKGFARNDNCLRHMRRKHDYPNGLEPVA